MKMTTAETILTALGGQAFIANHKAFNIATAPNYVAMQFPRSKKRAGNWLRIAESDGAYTVKYYLATQQQLCTVALIEGVALEDLKQVVEETL